MTATIDTICALATPAGRGGVSVVRLSGPLTAVLASKVAGRLPAPGQQRLATFRDRTGTVIDQGLLLYFAAPHSFTGEAVAEFHCHGSPIIVDWLLQTLVALGARLARPGEFSQRAFLNDKLDLLQAEAIADLIASSSSVAARHALRSLQGDFSRLITALVKQVIELRVYIEAALDFPEEEIDFLGQGHIDARLQSLQQQLLQTLASARQGALLQEGLKVVIAGAPNAGKSTLLNALSGDDIAIVTPIAGTTRDMLRQPIQVDGIPLTLVDTAGLHASEDPVEQEGMRRARAALTDADVVLLVVDAVDPVPFESSDLFAELQQQVGNRLTVILNKIDLLAEQPRSAMHGSVPCLYLSAHTGTGLPLLTEHLKQRAGFNPAEDAGFIARRRHLAALEQAEKGLAAARHCLKDLRAGELVAEELRKVQLALDEITGKFSSDDLLGQIFGSFCIGK